MTQQNKHLVTIIVGGSGTGKSTIVKELVSQGYYEKAITCTTRQPRLGEKNFVDYVFLEDKSQLDEMYKNNELLETPTEFGGNWYGCPLKSVYGKKPVVVILEYEGLKKALELLKRDNSVIVAPVFLEPLEEEEIINRMKKRSSSEEEILSRLKERKNEQKWGDNPNYILKIKQDTSLSEKDSVAHSVSLVADLIDSLKPKYTNIRRKKNLNKK